MAKTQATKEKMGTPDYIKLKNFGATNNTMKKMKGQSTEWEKISANHISDKGLVSRIYEELLKFNKKRNNPIKKWAEDMKNYFFQRRYTNGQQAHEKMLDIITH